MKNQAEICGDGPRLLWYAAGALGEAEAAQVARHVAVCAGCRALVQENEELVQLYRSVSRAEFQHVSPETLLQAASGEDIPGASNARAHLAGCRECQEILSVLERVQRDEEDSVGFGERLGARARSFWAAVAANAAWMKNPLPAYMLALLMLYPAYRGLVGGGATRDPHLLPPPLSVASETERGPSDAVVRVDAEGEQTVLTFFAPIAPDRYRYELEVRTHEGRRLFFAQDAQSFDGVGTFALTLPGGWLGPGAYELRLGERELDGGELVNHYVFPFSVE